MILIIFSLTIAGIRIPFHYLNEYKPRRTQFNCFSQDSKDGIGIVVTPLAIRETGNVHISPIPSLKTHFYLKIHICRQNEISVFSHKLLKGPLLLSSAIWAPSAFRIRNSGISPICSFSTSCNRCMPERLHSHQIHVRKASIS